jgi:hypothetical protein
MYRNVRGKYFGKWSCGRSRRKRCEYNSKFVLTEMLCKDVRKIQLARSNVCWRYNDTDGVDIPHFAFVGTLTVALMVAIKCFC